MFFLRWNVSICQRERVGFKRLQCMIKGSPNEYKTTGVDQNNKLFVLLVHFLCNTCAVQLPCTTCAVQLPTTSVVQDNQSICFANRAGAGLSMRSTCARGCICLGSLTVLFLNCKLYFLLSKITYLWCRYILSALSMRSTCARGCICLGSLTVFFLNWKLYFLLSKITYFWCRYVLSALSRRSTCARGCICLRSLNVFLLNCQMYLLLSKISYLRCKQRLAQVSPLHSYEDEAHVLEDQHCIRKACSSHHQIIIWICF